MKIHSKAWLMSMLCIASAIQANPTEIKNPPERTTLNRFVAIGLRLLETGAGVQMLWNGTPYLTDFFYFSEDETEIRPARVWGNEYRQIIRKKSMVPLGFIKLIRRIPTRFVGGALLVDGINGLWKEYNKMVDERVTREKELLFGRR